MSNETLLNSAQFAKICGVVPQTVRNLVDRGDIIPAQRVGSKNYFTPEQVMDYRLACVRSLVTKSFLVLVSKEDETAVTQAKALAMADIQKLCPEVKYIASLEDSLVKIQNTVPSELGDDQLFVIESNVIKAFISEVRSFISNFIGSIYCAEVKTRDFSFNQLLGNIIGSSVSEDFISAYKACGIQDINHTLDGMKTYCALHFDNLKRKYGIFVCCSDAKKGDDVVPFSLKEAFETDGSRILSGGHVMFDKSSPNAKAIYEKTLKKNIVDTSSLGIRKICEDGFATIIDAVGTFSAEQENRIAQAIISGDYKKIYLSGHSILPEKASFVLESLLNQKKVEVVYLDD